ncbi:Enolase [compost metagenome]
MLLADEGGLSPGFRHANEALDLMVESFEAAGLEPGHDMAIAIDVAASELFVDGRYELARHGYQFSGEQMADFIAECVRKYPVISVEDALEQDDWSNWKTFTAAVPGVQVIGDDLFVTNQERIAMGIERGAANGVLIKVNQNGTLSGTLDAMQTAWRAGYTTVVSARSGETEDSFIADLAVGTGAGQIKIGSVRSSERLAKYNQLLRIEEDRSLEFIGTACLGGNARRQVA